MGRSMFALIIKIATAGLSYLMLVTLSRCMDTESYGQFALGFSLATIFAIIAAFGQHMAILRLWPAAEEARRHEEAHTALGSGWVLTLSTGLGVSLLLILAGLYAGQISNEGPLNYITGAALLILPMAGAEYMSAALRAQGSVIIALTPRDIVWRSLVPFAVWIGYTNGIAFSGFGALALSAGILCGAVCAQFFLSRKRGYSPAAKPTAFGKFWQEHKSTSIWLWIATIMDTAVLNLDVVIVGALLTPEQSGLFLNAFRTAGLMTLFLFAINQVVAPIFSRHFHAGEIGAAQNVANFTVWAGFLFSVLVFACFALFGNELMKMFGDAYSSGAGILIILSAGLMIDAATGPTRIVMMMTGHQRSYVAIISATSVVAFAASMALVPFFGVVGAALVNAIARAGTQTLLVLRCRQLMGIDPSLFGIFNRHGTPQHG